MRRLAALLVLVATLCACGSRGSLYLPPPESDDVSAPKPKRR
ncbi:MAG TPA: lipoprotein [Burkholderiales bacterium]|nr:lipoprotein [Burkholderiales bacterium]